jgi:hypothetical protein
MCIVYVDADILVFKGGELPAGGVTGLSWVCRRESRVERRVESGVCLFCVVCV